MIEHRMDEFDGRFNALSVYLEATRHSFYKKDKKNPEYKDIKYNKISEKIVAATNNIIDQITLILDDHIVEKTTKEEQKKLRVALLNLQ